MNKIKLIKQQLKPTENFKCDHQHRETEKVYVLVIFRPNEAWTYQDRSKERKGKRWVRVTIFISLTVFPEIFS